jgi:hypothetical protein
MNVNKVTEITNMGESNGTNLRPIVPILLFKKAYENRRVLILHPDSWHERPWSINTPHRRKVLIYSVVKFS